MDTLFPIALQKCGIAPRNTKPGLDFYQTPAWATMALVEREPIGGIVIEPCCGEGAISTVLNSHGIQVQSSDLVDRGYGAVSDFLDGTCPEADWIITNPPYGNAEAFVREACRLTESRKGKVAMLLRLAFLEGQSRYTLFQETPLARIHIFSRRVNFLTGKSSAMPVAWFVWDWSSAKPGSKPTVSWIR